MVKDHKNPMIQELVNNSYEKCFQREMETFFGDYDFDCDCGTENVARCCLINPSYSSTLQKAMIKLQDAKLTIDLIGLDLMMKFQALEKEMTKHSLEIA